MSDHDDLARLLAVGHTAAQAGAIYLRSAPETGGELRELGYRQACARLDRLGTLFTGWGLAPGARLLIASRDDQAVAVTFLGCLERGVTALVADPHATAAELADLLAIQRPDAVIADRELLGDGPLTAVPQRLPVGATASGSLVGRLLRRPAAAAAFPEAVDALAPAAPAGACDPQSDAYVLFTSGSTARPKGVRISRRALAAHLRTLLARWGYDRGARILDPLPLHHTDGLIQGVLCAWACGGTCVRTGRFRVDGIIEQLIDPLYRERITHLVAVPTMLALLLRCADRESQAFRTADFRFVISAAGYLDERIWRDFETRFGVRVCNIYGLTETVTGGCFAGPDDASHVIGSVGLPVDCVVRVVGEDGGEVPAGTPGELLIRGDHVMSGYLNDAAASAASMSDGWLRTGDLATIDAAGLVRIVGRRKNLVISGGLNIQPEEVAEVLRSLPGVGDAVAFGIPDADFHEILVACVAAAEAGTALDTDELLRRCRERLAEFKLPRLLVQLPALPYGPSGKVAVPRARELFEAARAGGGRKAQGDVRSRVYAAAAEAFHLPLPELADDAAPGKTRGWDSFAHLAFIAGLEAACDVRLSAADIIAIRSLGDAVLVVDGAARG